MKTTSRFALAAAAGLFVGGIALTDARAADLGGDCCADLEERVAELEATTARKGNKKVSLEVSGQVNRALLAWDDGIDSDAFVVDNNYSSSRFRFKGSAQMKPGWKAGFLIEIETNDNSSNTVSAFDDEGNGDTTLRTRHANVWVESERLGRVTIGQGSPATDDLILINVSNNQSDAGEYYANAFAIRTHDNAGTFSGLTWSRLFFGFGDAYDTSRGDFVRYDTPAIYGFILSAAWGENDVWDVALRYQKEWNSFRIAAGIGYLNSGDKVTCGSNFFVNGSCNTSVTPNVVSVSRGTFEDIKGSASVMHIPTGLFVNFAAAERHWDKDLNDENKDATYWYVAAGIERKWLSYGKTTIYGEYGNYEDSAVGISTGTTGGFGIVTSSEVNRWGVGINQNFESAVLDIYLKYMHYSADIDTTGGVNGANPDLKDWQAGLAGMRIKF